MNIPRPLAIILSFGIGIVTAWGVPAEWFLQCFLFGICAALLLGVMGAATAKEVRPLGPGLKAASYLLIGTSRPNAEVRPGWVLLWFLLATAHVAGMGTMVIFMSLA